MVQPISSLIRGATIRLSWTAGPTKGKTHEHLFHEDGTVEWRSVDGGGDSRSDADGAAKERPQYMAREVGDQVVLVSYLSKSSGFTLTAALNFRDRTTVGVASNGKDWVPVEGAFERVPAAAKLGDA